MHTRPLYRSLKIWRRRAERGGVARVPITEQQKRRPYHHNTVELSCQKLVVVHMSVWYRVRGCVRPAVVGSPPYLDGAPHVWHSLPTCNTVISCRSVTRPGTGCEDWCYFVGSLRSRQIVVRCCVRLARGDAVVIFASTYN